MLIIVSTLFTWAMVAHGCFLILSCRRRCILLEDLGRVILGDVPESPKIFGYVGK